MPKKNINDINFQQKGKMSLRKGGGQISRSSIKKGMMGGYGLQGQVNDFGQDWGNWASDFGWGQEPSSQTDPYGGGWQNNQDQGYGQWQSPAGGYQQGQGSDNEASSKAIQGDNKAIPKGKDKGKKGGPPTR